MLIFVIITICIIFVGIQTAGKNEFYKDYCSPKQTTSINGLFTILIFISHIAQRLLKIPNGPMTDVLSAPYITFRTYMGQLVVVPFLFYSGYGITESIKRKGTNYVKAMPTNRIFKVWYHLAITVTLYVIYDLIFKIKYPVSVNLLAYTGWRDIGGSNNWYIFVSLVLYIIVFISFMIFRKSKILAVALTTVLALAFGIWEWKMGLGTRYYNTLMIFPLGMLFSLVKPYFDKLFLKNDVIWVLGLGAVFGACCYFGSVRNNSLVLYTLWAIFAAILLLFITMKVKIQNSILDWFGRHVFSIYVLQYLPMNVLQQFNFHVSHPYAFFVICFVSTIILATLFDAFTEKTDAIIFGKKKVVQRKEAQLTVNSMP